MWPLVLDGNTINIPTFADLARGVFGNLLRNSNRVTEEKPMYLDKIHSCCGVVDLANITPGFGKEDGTKTFEDVIKVVAAAKIKYPVVFFAGPTFIPRYVNLAKYIRDNDFGKVIETASRLKPNSGNMITAYLWEVNWSEVSNFKPEVKTVKPVDPFPTVPVPVAQAAPVQAASAPSTDPEEVTSQLIDDIKAEVAYYHTFPPISYQEKLERARERVKSGISNHRERRMVLRAGDREGARWS